MNNENVGQTDGNITLAYLFIGLYLLNRKAAWKRAVFIQSVAVTAYLAKRGLEDADESDRPVRRRRVQYNWLCTRACIFQDYWGSPLPLFSDKQFQRIFRVTRSILAEQLLLVCGNADAFFRDREDLQGNKCIDPKAKILISLKCFLRMFIDRTADYCKCQPNDAANY